MKFPEFFNPEETELYALGYEMWGDCVNLLTKFGNKQKAPKELVGQKLIEVRNAKLAYLIRPQIKAYHINYDRNSSDKVLSIYASGISPANSKRIILDFGAEYESKLILPKGEKPFLFEGLPGETLDNPNAIINIDEQLQIEAYKQIIDYFKL